MSTLAVSLRWQAVLGVVAVLASPFGDAYAAEPFFRDCKSAFATRSFERLKEFYAKSKDNPRPSNCFKLNRNEFLVTVKDTGRIGQGLYYYDATTNSYGLVDGRHRPNIEIKLEFLGAGSKRYVLLGSSNLHQGAWRYGYEILYLTAGKKRQSFTLTELLVAQEDPESGFCGSRLSQVATSITGFHILGEGSPSVRIEFAVEEENCGTLKRRRYTRVFQPHNGVFSEVVGDIQ